MHCSLLSSLWVLHGGRRHYGVDCHWVACPRRVSRHNVPEQFDSELENRDDAGIRLCSDDESNGRKDMAVNPNNLRGLCFEQRN